jgi:hypothetical protein
MEVTEVAAMPPAGVPEQSCPLELVVISESINAHKQACKTLEAFVVTVMVFIFVLVLVRNEL